MSKLIVIFYSFLILVQSFNINLEDFSKFNALLEHAHYHQDMYGDNIFEFISEHYGAQMVSHESKHEEHEGLPFKDEHHVFTHINTVFTLFSTIAFTVHAQVLTEIPLNFFYKESISLFEKPSVFQPPQFA
ncbi:hypothetical protein ACFFU9_04735 [Mariniflexile ostreae]|uniref:Uncharacterized protein n=1 Tax=Mariniflexile ostreae TaxID=1520892 RepID=A0ABV5F9C3_9FLAO